MYSAKPRRQGKRAEKREARRANPVAIAASVAVGALFGDGAHAKNIQVERVAAGNAKVNQNGPHTTIVASNRTIIDYTRFDVAQYESVQFVLPNVHSSILNRINSADPSHIDGQVVGNGSIYFANPAGVVFGPHAVLNVGQLFAAAGNISNRDFLAGKNHFTVGQGSVVNDGSIHADTIMLVGRQVVNHGVIVGDSVVTMASGDDVLVGDRTGGVLVKMNASTVGQTTPSAPALPLGAGDLYSLAINNTGQVKGPGINVQAASGTVNVSGQLDASSKTGAGGNITITAPRVGVNSANINASGKTGGGTILVGGDAHGKGTLPHATQTSISAGSTLNADATQSGSGGKVVVWSDSATEFHGVISARGGATSGDGGFVETSGHALNIQGGSVDTSAPNGNVGNWLLDPAGVTISSNPSDITGTISGGIDTFTDASGSNVSFTDINAALGTTNVTVSSSTNLAVSVPVLPDVGIVKSTGTGTTTLKLTAKTDITVAAPISSTAGPLNVDIQTTDAAGNVSIQQPITTAGGFFHSTANTAGTGSTFETTAGAIIDTRNGINPAGDVQIDHDGTVTLGANVFASSISARSHSGNVVVSPFVIIAADTQSYWAGAGDGSTTGTVTLTALVNTPIFTGTAGGSPASFTQRQDLAISALVDPTKFGGPDTPAAYSLQSDTGAITITAASSLTSASALTLQGKGISLPSGLSLKSLSATTTDTGQPIALNGAVTTTGGQTYTGPVTLAADSTLTTTNSPVTFNSTVDGNQALETDTTGGLTKFAGNVGAGTPLTTLTVNSGPVEVDAAQVFAATQIYNKSAAINPTAGTTFTATTSITFGTGGVLTDSVSGNATSDVSLVSPSITLNIPVNAINSLTTSAGSATAINGGQVKTTAAQNYGGPVTLGANTGLDGSTLTNTTIDATVANHYDLTLKFGGTITIDDAIFLNVGNLTVGPIPGAATLIDGNVTTTGGQTYNDPVTIQSTPPNPNVLTAGGDVTFGSTITGSTVATFASKLSIAAPAHTVEFKGAVGDPGATLSPLTSLEVNAGATGNTIFRGNVQAGSLVVDHAATISDISITTTDSLVGADQTYGGNITLTSAVPSPGNGTTAIIANRLQYAQILGGNVNNLLMNVAVGTNGGTGLNVDPTAILNIHNFTATSAAGISITGNITTTGFQTYNSAVTMGAANILLTAGGDITFTSTVNAPTTNLVLDASTHVAIFGAALTLGSLNVLSGPSEIDGGSISTNGTGIGGLGQVYHSIVTLNGGTLPGHTAVALNDTGTGTITFLGRLNGSIAAGQSADSDLSIDTGALTAFGRAVSLGSLRVKTGKTEIDGGSITTDGTGPILTGSSIHVGQYYANDVALNKGTYALASTDPVVLTDTAAGGITFAGKLSGSIAAGQLIDSNLSLSSKDGSGTPGLVTFAGAVSAGSVKVLHGAAEIDGGAVTTFGTGAPMPLSLLAVGQYYAGNVTLNGGSYGFAANDPVTLRDQAGGGMTFQQNLHGAIASGQSANSNLTINTSALTTLAGDVKLGSLKVVGGNTEIDGPSIATAGTGAATPPTGGTLAVGQYYANQVILNGGSFGFTASSPIQLSDSAAGAITFRGTVTGSTTTLQPVNSNLQISTKDGLSNPGLVTFAGAVTTGSLKVIDGATEIDGGAVTTFNTGTPMPSSSAKVGQYYAGAVQLNGTHVADPSIVDHLPAVLLADQSGGRITAAGTLTGSTSDLTVNSNGVVTFGGAVTLKSLTVDHASEIDGGSVATSAGQSYLGDVTLNGAAAANPSAISTHNPVSLSDSGASSIVFAKQLMGSTASGQSANSDLSIDTHAAGPVLGTVTFGGAVSLGSLQVNLGHTEIDGGAVATAGTGFPASSVGNIGQFYHDDVVTNGPHTALASIVDQNPVALSDSGAGSITFRTTLQGSVASGQAIDSDVRINSQSGATLGQITFASTVDLGALQVLGGNAEFDGGRVSTAGAGTSAVGGSGKVGQYYHDAVTLNGPHAADASIVDASSPPLFSFTDSGAGAITFRGPLSATVAGGQAVDASVNFSSPNLTTPGIVTFAGTVNVGSLKVINQTSAEIDGATINTLGTGSSLATPPVVGSLPMGQYYSGAVTINGGHAADPGIADANPVSLSDAHSGAITFDQTVFGSVAQGQSINSDLRISTKDAGLATIGQVTFAKTVDLGALQILAGNTEIDGGRIATAGSGTPAVAGATGNVGQYYHDDVTLNGPHAGDPGIVPAIAPPMVTFSDSGAGSITFRQSLSGVVPAQAVNANVNFSTQDALSNPGLVTFGGVVNVGALKVLAGNTEIDGGSIATLGTGSNPLTPPIIGALPMGQYFGGNVTLNGAHAGDPAITTHNPVSLSDSGAGAITVRGSLSGSVAAGQATDSDLILSTINGGMLGTVTFGGAVDLGSLRVLSGHTEIDGGRVTTNGTGLPASSVGNIGQYYHDDVTVNGTHAADPSITTHNPALLDDTGAGSITFHSTLSGSVAQADPIDSDVRISTQSGPTLGQITFGGAVDVGALQVLAGNVEIDGARVTTAGAGTSPIGGSGKIGQYYHDAVVVDGSHVADASIVDATVPATVSFTDTGAGSIAFRRTLSGTVAAGQTVDVTANFSSTQAATTGLVTFGGAVNLGALKVLNGTQTEIDGGSITTRATGSNAGVTPVIGTLPMGQYYSGAVTLNGPHSADPAIADQNPVSLTDVQAGAITFRSTLNGLTANSDLVISTQNAALTPGQVTFGGAVGLGSLQVMAGLTEIDGGSMTTAGTGLPTSSAGKIGQYYHDAVVINGNHVADPSGIIDHNSPPVALSDTAAGSITFRTTLFGSIAQGEPINSDLTIATNQGAASGLITFGGAVDLGSIKVLAGNSEIDGGSVTTHGTGLAAPIPGGSGGNVGQYYAGNVVLNGSHATDATIVDQNPVNIRDTATGAITFAQTLFGSLAQGEGINSDLQLSTSDGIGGLGRITFGKAVDLGSLQVQLGHSEIDGGSVTTAGTGLPASSVGNIGQYYHDDVTINGPHLSDPGIVDQTAAPAALTDTGAGSVTFRTTLFGSVAQGQATNSDLVIATNNGGSLGLVSFGGAVDLGSLKVMNGHVEIDGGSVTTAGTGAHLPGGSGNVGQYYHDDVVANGNHVTDLAGISDHNPLSLVDTDSGSITFRTILSGSTATAQPINSDLLINSQGLAIFGGAVSLGSLKVSPGPSEIDGGSVTTFGTGTPASPLGNYGQYYFGVVTVNGSHPSDPTIILAGPNVSLTDNGNGTITFVNQLNGAAPSQLATNLTISTSNWTTFGQPVRLGSLSVQGPAEIDGGSVATAGTAIGNIGQYYHGDVVINGPHLAEPVISDHNPPPVLLSDSANGAIIFQKTLHGSVAQGQPINSDMATDSAGLTVFGGAVDLGSLKVLTGPSEIDGGSVITAGTGAPTPPGGAGNLGQFYHGVVTLNDGSYGLAGNNPVTLTDSNAGSITFHTTLSGSVSSGRTVDSNLDARTNGLTTFGGPVSLGSLRVLEGASEIDGDSVVTFGTGSPIPGGVGNVGQYFHGNVTLNGNSPSDTTIVLGAPNIALTDNGAGTITFAAQLNGAAPAQPLNSNLTINTAGLTTFGGATKLGSLKVMNGPAEIDGGSVATANTGSPISGSVLAVGQYYFNAVTINGSHTSDPAITDHNASPVALSDSSNGAITFRAVLDGSTATGQPINSNLEITTGGLTTFGGTVSIGSLKVLQGPSEIDGGAVTTFGTGAAIPGGSGNVGQYYRGDVAVNGNHPSDPAGISDHNPATLTDAGAGTITFSQKLSGSTVTSQPILSDLVINTTALSTFGGAVTLGSLGVQGPAEIDGGSVQTAGTAAGNIGQFYHDTVVINGPHASDPAISDHNPPPVALTDTASGEVIFLKTLSGAVAAGQPINSDLAIDTAGLSVFGGAVTLGSLKVLTGPSEIDGGSVATAGTGSPFSGSSNLGQYYRGTVALNDGSFGLASNNPVAFSDSNGGTITLHTTLSGATSSGQLINSDAQLSTAGLTTFGGPVTLGSLKVLQGPAEIDGGTVTTFGTGSGIAPFPGSVGQFYANDVTLDGPRTSDTSIPNAGANVTLLDNGSGTVTFMGLLTGPASNLTVNTAGLTSFQKAVDLGSLITNGGGTTAINGGSVTTATFQQYFDAVTLGAPNTLAKAGSDVIFFSTVTGASNLTVLAPGVTRFNDVVNVASVTTDAPGTTAIDGGSVTTTTSQFYGDPVNLGRFKPAPATALNAGGPVTFSQTLDGASNLTITTGALATFGGTVGSSTPLSSLTINGLSEIDGGAVTTSNFQLYNNNVSLNGPHANDATIHDRNPVTFNAGGTITYVGQLSGPSNGSDVSINTPALTTFGGAVTLGSVKVLQGPAEIDGGSVTSAGTGTAVAAAGSGGVGQYYAFDVTLNGAHSGSSAISSHDPVQFVDTENGNVAFAAGLNTPSTANVTVTTNGLTSFLGPVNLTSLTTDGGNVTKIAAGSVTTRNQQTYNDDVVLGSDNTLASTNGGEIRFAATLNGGFGLTVNTSGQTTFVGAVGNSAPLASLTTDAGGTTSVQGRAVTTVGNQTYGDDVVFTNDTTFTSNASGNVVFDQTLTGSALNLLVNTGGTTGFQGNVNVGTLTTDAPGQTAIGVGNTLSVITVGNMLFGDNVSTSGNVTVNATGAQSSIHFEQSADFNTGSNSGSTTITANNGEIRFGQTAPGTGLPSYHLNLGGVSDDIQSHRGNIIFNAATTMNAGSAAGASVASAGGTITFNSDATLAGAAATVDSSTGSITFNGTTDLAGQNTSIKAIGAGGNITFTGDTTLEGANTVITSKPDPSAASTSGGNILFSGPTLTFNAPAGANDPTKPNVVISTSSADETAFRSALSVTSPAYTTGQTTGTVEVDSTVYTVSGSALIMSDHGDVTFNGQVLGATISAGQPQPLAAGQAMPAQATSLIIATNGNSVPVNASTLNDATVVFNQHVNSQLGEQAGTQVQLGSLVVAARNILVTDGVRASGDLTLQPNSDGLRQFQIQPTTANGQKVKEASVPIGFAPFLPDKANPSLPDLNAPNGVIFFISSANANYVPPPDNGKAKLNEPNVNIDVKGNVVLSPAAAPEIVVTDPKTGQPLTDHHGQPIKEIPISSVATIWTLTPDQLNALSKAESGSTGKTKTGQGANAKTHFVPPLENLSFTSNNFEMGRGQKLTDLGDLTITANNEVILSDLNASGKLQVSAPWVVMRYRIPSFLLDDQGNILSHDNGLDFFGAAGLIFDKTQAILRAQDLGFISFTPGRPALPNAGARDAQFGIFQGEISPNINNGTFITHENRSKKPDPRSLVFAGNVTDNGGSELDALATGPGNFEPTNALLQPVETAEPQVTEETEFDPGLEEELKKLGIRVRHLRPVEITNRTRGRIIYLDTPPLENKRSWDELREEDFVLMAADRLPGSITNEVVKANRFVYAKGKDQSAPTVLAQRQIVKQQIFDAWGHFNESKPAKFDPKEFRLLLECGRFKEARIAIDRTRDVGKLLEVLGLTPIQVDHCKSVLIDGMLPAGGSPRLTKDQLTRTVFTLTPAKPLPASDVLPAAYLLKGSVESGNIRVDGGASN